MAGDHTEDDWQEQRWDEALAACLEVAENGTVSDREAILARYPEFAAELAEFLARREQIERWAAPLRRTAQGDHEAHSITAPGHGRLGDFRMLRHAPRSTAGNTSGPTTAGRSSTKCRRLPG